MWTLIYNRSNTASLHLPEKKSFKGCTTVQNLAMKKKHMIAKKDMSESSLEMEDMKWNKNHVSTGPLHNLGKLEIFLFCAIWSTRYLYACFQ